MKNNIAIIALVVLLVFTFALYNNARKVNDQLVSTVYSIMLNDLRYKGQSVDNLINYYEVMNSEAVGEPDVINVPSGERILQEQIPLTQSFNDVLPESQMMNELNAEWANTFGMISETRQYRKEFLEDLIAELGVLGSLIEWKGNPDSLVVDLERIMLQLGKINNELLKHRSP